MTTLFGGKVALITGGNSGIGRATALAFAREGAAVVIAARDAEKGAETLRLLEEAPDDTPPALFLPTDVTDPEACAAAVARIFDTFGRLDVLVNCVAPGSVETPMLRKEWEDMGGEAEVRQLFEDKHPMGRISQPEEIARAILFLASPKASFITGVCLPVDAGLTAG